MKGMIFENPTPEVVAARPWLHGELEGFMEWVESGESGRTVWIIKADDRKGQYAIHHRWGGFPGGCRAGLFNLDDINFLALYYEEQHKALREGVPGEIVYVPAKTRFMPAWKREFIVDSKTGCWRPTSLFDW